MRTIQLTEDQLKALIESVNRDVHPESVIKTRRRRSKQEMKDLKIALVHLQVSLNSMFCEFDTSPQNCK